MSPALLDKVESVEVEVYPRARVVVNERTGTVVIGGTVRLQPVSILHGGLSVNVISTTEVSQPGPLSARHDRGRPADQRPGPGPAGQPHRSQRRRDGRGSGPGIATNRGGGAGRDLDPAGDERGRRSRGRPGGSLMRGLRCRQSRPATENAAGSSRSKPPQPRLVRAAHEFEAQMMKELLKPMTGRRRAYRRGRTIGRSWGSNGALGEFASEALGQALSQHGGFGMADRIVHGSFPFR